MSIRLILYAVGPNKLVWEGNMTRGEEPMELVMFLYSTHKGYIDYGVHVLL